MQMGQSFKKLFNSLLESVSVVSAVINVSSVTTKLIGQLIVALNFLNIYCEQIAVKILPLESEDLILKYKKTSEDSCRN